MRHCERALWIKSYRHVSIFLAVTLVLSGCGASTNTPIQAIRKFLNTQQQVKFDSDQGSADIADYLTVSSSGDQHAFILFQAKSASLLGQPHQRLTVGSMATMRACFRVEQADGKWEVTGVYVIMPGTECSASVFRR